MFKNVLAVILFLGSGNCFAQQDYFVQIQADNKQPFYATINGHALTSSDAGYLVIPKLRDTVYEIGIAFPQDIWSEQKFSIAVGKKDQSFQLKNLGEKGWALFNPTTSEWKISDKAAGFASKKAKGLPTKKEDAFSRLMAGVVNDTSVMYNNYVEEEPEIKTVNGTNSKPVKIDSPLAAITRTNLKDSSKNKMTPAISQVEKSKVTPHKIDTLKSSVAVVKQPLPRAKDSVLTVKKLSFVKMLKEQKNDSALHLVFADVLNKGGIDTIDVIIPFDVQPVVTELPKKNNAKKEAAPEVAKKVNQPKDSVKPIVIHNEKQAFRRDSVREDTAKTAQRRASKVTLAKDCTSPATDYDIDKLRIKMLMIENDDDKINAARNVFKVKCFSVKQVHALSEVFKTDEGKYKLFDAVYVHVSDVGNFIELQQLLSDSYYINRFKAMIR
ncbi:MAG TPA: DUF4476 domain-containing protein [Puia sp.]|jgi:hypothetical protein|nr:DUF4476 domain-containing protein [Puia sp.]